MTANTDKWYYAPLIAFIFCFSLLFSSLNCCFHGEYSGEYRSRRRLNHDVAKSHFSEHVAQYNRQLCYASDAARLEAIDGRFEERSFRSARYWNLSCPLELSKQSCSHFGVNISHAEFAAKLQFIPSACLLLSREQLVPFFGSNMNLRIIFIGNSIIRQVMTGIVCDMHAMGLVVDMNVEWASCEKKQYYPCHGSLKCIECGPHSGWHHAKIFIAGGGSMDFVDGLEVIQKIGQDKSKIDIIVAQKFVTQTNLNVVLDGEWLIAHVHNRGCACLNCLDCLQVCSNFGNFAIIIRFLSQSSSGCILTALTFALRGPFTAKQLGLTMKLICWSDDPRMLP